MLSTKHKLFLLIILTFMPLSQLQQQLLVLCQPLVNAVSETVLAPHKKKREMKSTSPLELLSAEQQGFHPLKSARGQKLEDREIIFICIWMVCLWFKNYSISWQCGMFCCLKKTPKILRCLSDVECRLFWTFCSAYLTMTYSLYPEICWKNKLRLTYNQGRLSSLWKPQFMVKKLAAVHLCMVVLKILHQHLL